MKTQAERELTGRLCGDSNIRRDSRTTYEKEQEYLMLFDLVIIAI